MANIVKNENSIPTFKNLIETFFENGGQQAMITVVDRNELERAMEEPEKYAETIRVFLQ